MGLARAPRAARALKRRGPCASAGRVVIDTAHPDDQAVLQAYATWQLLRRLRARAKQGAPTLHAADRARKVLAEAACFLHALREHDLDPGSCTQAELGDWLTTRPRAHRLLPVFLTWRSSTTSRPPRSPPLRHLPGSSARYSQPTSDGNSPGDSCTTTPCPPPTASPDCSSCPTDSCSPDAGQAVPRIPTRLATDSDASESNHGPAATAPCSTSPNTCPPASWQTSSACTLSPQNAGAPPPAPAGWTTPATTDRSPAGRVAWHSRTCRCAQVPTCLDCGINRLRVLRQSWSVQEHVRTR